MTGKNSRLIPLSDEEQGTAFDHSGPRFDFGLHLSTQFVNLIEFSSHRPSSGAKVILSREHMISPSQAPVLPILDSNISFASFVEAKFVPEHVEYKTSAGRTHYQAILKHLLKPETVNRIFGKQNASKSKLKALNDWPYLDDVRLGEISPDHVLKIMYAAANRGYSSQTIKHLRNVIGAIITHAQRENCFSGVNPAFQLQLPPVKHKPRHGLTLQQTKAILGMMQFPEKEIALITMFTGLTITEICRLQWKHVNLGSTSCFVDGDEIPPSSLAIRKSLDLIIVGASMSRHAKSVAIPGPLFPVLVDLKRRQGGEIDPDQFVFPSANGSQLLPSSIRMGRLKPIGKSLGLPGLSWHDLRRVHKGLVHELMNEFGDVAEKVPSPIPPLSRAPQAHPAFAVKRSMCRSFFRRS